MGQLQSMLQRIQEEIHFHPLLMGQKSQSVSQVKKTDAARGRIMISELDDKGAVFLGLE